MRRNKLVTLQLILSFASLTSLHANTSLIETPEILMEFDFSRKPMMKWQAGALISLDNYDGSPALIRTFDKSGRKINDQYLQVPGSSYLTVRDYSRAADGTLGLCGTIDNPDKTYSSYVAFVSPTSASPTVVRMTSFMPMKIIASADGTFWTLGFEYRPRSPYNKPEPLLSNILVKDAFTFRQFDRSGKQVRGVVPQSAIIDPIALSNPNVFVELGKEIIWYSSVSRQLISISRDGSYTDIKDLALPNDERQNGHAISEDGSLILSAMSNTSWSVLKLMPSRREWQTLSQGLRGDKSKRPIVLLGSEASTLYSLGNSGSGIRTFQIAD